MEIPVLSNNTTENLKQKKIISLDPVDQATDKSSGPYRKITKIRSGICCKTFVLFASCIFAFVSILVRLCQFLVIAYAINCCSFCSEWFTAPGGSVVEHPLRDRKVVGSIPGRVIPKALKMVPVASSLGAQLY